MMTRLILMGLAGFALAAAELPVEDKDLPRVPATPPEQAVSTFRLREGLQLELVASEPLLNSPVAMAFDERSRLFVVEMRDYSERRDEQLGRIKLLEDTNGDGRYDKATLFAETLAWPTAVICFDGGVFVGATPDIFYFKDTDGDGRVDVRKVVFTGFGAAAPRLNVQQLLNSFTWGLDNRIHGALGGNASVVTNLARPELKPVELRGRDFSFDPRLLDLRAESGNGQWGLTFDDEGNKFTCSNARHLIGEMYEERLGGRNPFYVMPPPDVDIAADGPSAEIFRISPDEPWRVVRTKWRVSGLVAGPVEGGGRPSGYFSAASAVTIYRGDALPAEFRGDVFIADCGGNLVHRKKLRREGLNWIGARPAGEERREFLASRDNWSRPVSLANAPDGALHVVDMYREVIEHPWSLPPELKSRIDLNSGNDRGRIYRVVPEKFQLPQRPELAGAPTADLVKLLEHPNGWHRDTAARLLYERRDAASVPALRELAGQSKSVAARLLALHGLKSLGALQSLDLAGALKDASPAVRRQAVRLVGESAPATLARDPEVTVRYELALACPRPEVLEAVIRRDVEQPWSRAAVLNGLKAGGAGLLARLLPDQSFVSRAGAPEFLRDLARVVGASRQPEEVARAVEAIGRGAGTMSYASALAGGLQRSGATLQQLAPESARRLAATARAVAVDAAAAERERMEAVQLIGSLRAVEAGGALAELLGTGPSPALQSALSSTLIQLGGDGPGMLLARWSQLSAPVRSRVLSPLLARKDGALALLAALEQGKVSRTELSAAEVQRLTSHADQAVQVRARAVFPRETSRRSEVVAKFRPTLALSGEEGRGRVIYLQRCASCHRAGPEGFAVGPDLASVAANGREKLLISILDPNAEVAAAFVAYTAETRDGESYSGVLAGENAQAVTLKLPNGETQRLLRQNLAGFRANTQSLMPEGLEEGLSVAELADLLEFVVRAQAAK